ncbi:MAG TPA: flagellum-specific ATP synthase FliI, partial [Comamonas denitrificans]|nr:flagellum-specific ATP synthase FliI [Comamonas denitrificans]
MAELAQQLQAMLQQGSARLKQPLPLPHHGTLTRLTGLVLESSGLRAPV